MRRPRLAAARILVVSALLVPMVPALAISVAEPWHVEGHSMEPALQDGSVLLVDAIGPRLGGYSRGDIVVVPVPASTNYPHPILVKRIVAVAGDHVRIADGVVTINGVTAHEPYLAPGTTTPVGTTPVDVVVPDGAVFVMGDHRANSFDSKAFGPVQASSIVGRAWLAIAPGGTVELPGAAAGEP
jgi:signal peptidase I